MALTQPVQRALQELRQIVDSLAHESDRHKAWSLFADLEERGERPGFDDVQRWALACRFNGRDARDMANMPEDIHYLRGRLCGGAGWGAGNAWFADD